MELQLYFLHFTDRETKVYRDWVIEPKAHSWNVIKLKGKCIKRNITLQTLFWGQCLLFLLPLLFSLGRKQCIWNFVEKQKIILYALFLLFKIPIKNHQQQKNKPSAIPHCIQYMIQLAQSGDSQLFFLFFIHSTLWKTRIISCVLEGMKRLKIAQKLASNPYNAVAGVSGLVTPRKAIGSMAFSFSWPVLQAEHSARATLSHVL